jgi:hypothetical protein
MPNKLTRYGIRLTPVDEVWAHAMIETSDGEFVKHEDYAALEKERDAECENWQKQCTAMQQKLDALTAEPVAQFYKSEHGNVFNTLDGWTPKEGVNHLYTAPPVAALKLPDEKSTDIDYAYYPLTKARHEGWNACLAEVKRLNATAPEEKPE